MKKAAIALILSLAINLVGMYVNYRNFVSENYLLWAFRSHGGEITVEAGFGLRAVHIYPMLPNEKATHSLSFGVLNFAVFLLGIALIIYCLILIAGMIWKLPL